jgi:hypothetical protein
MNKHWRVGGGEFGELDFSDHIGKLANIACGRIVDGSFATNIGAVAEDDKSL